MTGLEIILSFFAMFIGIFLGYYIRKQKALGEVNSAEAKAEKIISEAKSGQKELAVKAQEKAIDIINEAKQEEKKKQRELNDLQKRLEKRETTFSQKLLELQDKQQKLYDKVAQVEDAKEQIKKIRDEQLEKIEKIAKLNKEEAKEVLFKNVEVEIKDDLMVAY